MHRQHPTTTAPAHLRRARTARTMRAARMIEHRRPAPVAVAVEPAVPVTPVLRFDDEPMFVGSHLEAQLVQRQWRWW